MIASFTPNNSMNWFIRFDMTEQFAHYIYIENFNDNKYCNAYRKQYCIYIP